MPRVSVKINTGLQIPSRRRAGLVIYPGKPQEFDVTDEQLVTLLDDQHLIVNEIDENAAAEGAQEGEQVQGGENTQGDSSEGQEGTENDPQGDDQGAGEGETNGEDAGEAAEGEENGDAEGSEGSEDTQKQGEGNDQGEEAELPAIPSTAAAIKKQNRDIVVAQAQSLGIELDYADEKNVTKGVIADAIVAKQGE